MGISTYTNSYGNIFDVLRAGTSIISNQISNGIIQYPSEDELLIEIDLPGVSKEDVSLTVKQDIIQVNAVRKRNDKIVSNFNHGFRMTEGIHDPESVSGKLENGVLSIHIKYIPVVQPKQIIVQ